eukprot:c27954_g1_i1 orf=134-319(+)
MLHCCSIKTSSCTRATAPIYCSCCSLSLVDLPLDHPQQLSHLAFCFSKSQLLSREQDTPDL